MVHKSTLINNFKFCLSNMTKDYESKLMQDTECNERRKNPITTYILYFILTCLLKKKGKYKTYL